MVQYTQTQRDTAKLNQGEKAGELKTQHNTIEPKNYQNKMGNNQTEPAKRSKTKSQ